VAGSRTTVPRAQRRARGTRTGRTTKPRRVENRELPELMGVRMTTDQRQALMWKSKQEGFKSPQDFIRAYLQPVFDEAKLAALADAS
jgi:hypothetical protein